MKTLKVEGEGLLKSIKTARGMLKKDNEKSARKMVEVYRTFNIHQWTNSDGVWNSGNEVGEVGLEKREGCFLYTSFREKKGLEKTHN